MEDDIRTLEISVISDIHLGTHASKAKSLLKYLKSINPRILILNGDIIDSWRFSRNYFPKPHLKVIRQIIRMLEKGTRIVYVTGNHDEVFRKFNKTRIGNFEIVNQFEITLNNNRTWIFHGDIFDLIIHQAKWLAKLGAAAYGFLTIINKLTNQILKHFGIKEVIFYKSMKDRILKDKTTLTKFEQTLARMAAFRNYQTVICGHTHIPVDKVLSSDKGPVRYLNCGDWVEHFTAAEYDNNEWNLLYFKGEAEEEPELVGDDLFIPDQKQLYRKILEEFAVASLF